MTDHRNDDRDDQLTEVPEADALEQSRGLDDDEDMGRVDPSDFEKPEADALEQRRQV